MEGEGNNLYVYGGVVGNGLITGEWDSIFVGNQTSEEIEFVQPFDIDLKASTIYASSCPNSKIIIDIAANNTYSGLNYTNGHVYSVRDICSPCEVGFYFNIENSECQKCEKKCKRNQFAIVICEYTTELTCEECPVGTSTPDNSISTFCIPNSKKKEEHDALLIIFLLVLCISVFVLGKVFYDYIKILIKKRS